MEPLDPEEPLYFVSEGLPMGWSWALFFCQKAMGARRQSRSARRHARLRWALGGPDPTPAPGLGPGSPVAPVYLDNATLIGLNFKDTLGAYACKGARGARQGGPHRRRLRGAEEGHLGGGLRAGHGPSRAPSQRWASLATLQVNQGAPTSWPCERRDDGVHHATDISCTSDFFSLWRCGMSAMLHVYRHAELSPRNTLYPLDRATTKELEILMGLVFITSSLDLSATTMPFAMCSDAVATRATLSRRLRRPRRRSPVRPGFARGGASRRWSRTLRPYGRMRPSASGGLPVWPPRPSSSGPSRSRSTRRSGRCAGGCLVGDGRWSRCRWSAPSR